MDAKPKVQSLVESLTKVCSRRLFVRGKEPMSSKLLLCPPCSDGTANLRCPGLCPQTYRCLCLTLGILGPLEGFQVIQAARSPCTAGVGGTAGGRCRAYPALVETNGEQACLCQQWGREHLEQCPGRQYYRNGLLSWLINTRAAIKTKYCEYDTC